MKLTPVNKPDGKLTPDADQGEPITTSTGWTVQGFRDKNDRYVERATRATEEKWFSLSR